MTYKYIPSAIWMSEIAKEIGFTPLEIRIVMEAFHEYFSREASRSPIVLELKNSSVCDKEFILKRFNELTEKQKKVVMLTSSRKSFGLNKKSQKIKRNIKEPKKNKT